MAEIIRKATEKDVHGLKLLWNQCFPNDITYAEFFFDKIFRISSARVCERDGALAGMLHSFSRTLVCGNEKLSAKYIYGVGTAKKFRGNGIAGRMLDYEASNCDVLLLIPQSESLFGFYKKYGFSYLAKIEVLNALPKGAIDLHRATEKDIPYLNSVYEKHLENTIHAERDFEAWKLLLSEYEFLGGGFFVFDGGYCAQYDCGQKCELSEFFSDKTDFEKIAGAFGKECIIKTKGNSIPIAVMKPVTESGALKLSQNSERYINLMHN